MPRKKCSEKVPLAQRQKNSTCLGIGVTIGQDPKTPKSIERMEKDELVFRMKHNKAKILKKAGLAKYPFRVDRVGKATLKNFLMAIPIKRI